ncbi:MAG TPA: MiaB/RimO family radical SAM methylthiotransferase [Candidatus Margulisiibacteriota bacterium]|nr:MiaB/RimO family radical SAM methylthiotransferase [Candidatus Margulisiibacteriota bacterium]
MKEKIGILSLGCPRNLVDSENILGRLKRKGFSVSDDITKADVALVNTCSFIEDARKESIEAILDLVELKKEGKLRKIIVYGCLAQRYKDELRKSLPEVDAFVGKVSLNHETQRFPLTPKHYAYLKICEGCINNCSFCVIPKIKGRFRSLDTASLLKKVEAFNRQKISELNIIGQDITGYGMDNYGGARLAWLIKRILKSAPDIRWLRLLYLYPSRVNEELLRLIAAEPQLCRYIDLPIQHINGRILKLMRRKTGRADILKVIAKARSIIPGVALRTSLIVGFPSETDKEFDELLKFVEEARFERLGVFIYSPEEGTSAYDFKPQVPQKVKEERFNRIMSAQQQISREINNGFLGKFVDVLIEEKDNGYYLGRIRQDAPEVDGQVFVRSVKNIKPGDFVKVKITDTLEYDLIGEVQE